MSKNKIFLNKGIWIPVVSAFGLFFAGSIITIATLPKESFIATGMVNINKDLSYYVFVSYQDFFKNNNVIKKVETNLSDSGVCYENGKHISSFDIKKMISTVSYDSYYKIVVKVESKDKTIVMQTCTELLNTAKKFMLEDKNVDYRNNLREIEYPKEITVYTENIVGLYFIAPLAGFSAGMVAYAISKTIQNKKPISYLKDKLNQLSTKFKKLFNKQG